MKPVKIIFGVVMLATGFAACKNADFKKTRGGVPYKIFSEGKSKDTIGTGSIVKYQTIIKVKDSVVQSSYNQMPVYVEVRPGTGNYLDPVMDILPGTKKGDSIYFVQAMDSFIARQPEIVQRTPFRKGDQVVTTIRIVDVFKTPEQAQADYIKESKAANEKMEKENLKGFNQNQMAQAQMKTDSRIIEDYLASKNIHAEKTPWGVYLQVLDPGQGPKPSLGNFVTVRYKGTNLNGEVFDQGTYPFQIGTGGSIKGFEEGVRQLGKGGKAIAYIPSVLGYGSRGSGKIQPNQNLIFELELLDISDTPPAQQQQPVPDTSGRSKR